MLVRLNDDVISNMPLVVWPAANNIGLNTVSVPPTCDFRKNPAVLHVSNFAVLHLTNGVKYSAQLLQGTVYKDHMSRAQHAWLGCH